MGDVSNSFGGLWRAAAGGFDGRRWRAVAARAVGGFGGSGCFGGRRGLQERWERRLWRAAGGRGYRHRRATGSQSPGAGAAGLQERWAPTTSGGAAAISVLLFLLSKNICVGKLPKHPPVQMQLYWRVDTHQYRDHLC